MSSNGPTGPTVHWLAGADMLELLADLPNALRQAGAIAPWLSIGLMVLHSVVPFPSEILTLANGAVFGPAWGFVLSWTGAMLGAWFAYARRRQSHRGAPGR